MRCACQEPPSPPPHGHQPGTAQHLLGPLRAQEPGLQTPLPAAPGVSPSLTVFPSVPSLGFYLENGTLTANLYSILSSCHQGRKLRLRAVRQLAQGHREARLGAKKAGFAPGAEA